MSNTLENWVTDFFSQIANKSGCFLIFFHVCNLRNRVPNIQNFIQLFFLVPAEGLILTDAPIKETTFAEES